MRYIVGVIALLMLTGCGHVPPSSLLKLWDLDMLTIDPGQIRVAVSMPEGLKVRTSGGVLEIGVRESIAGKARSEKFVLEEDLSDVNRDGLPAGNGIIERLSVFRIAPVDLSRMRTLQREIAGRKSRYPDAVDGFLMVGAGGCRTVPLKSGPLPTTTWMKTSDVPPFFILTRQTDLRTVIPDESLQSELPSCED